MAARDATRLRQLAAEAFAVAAQMRDPSCKRGMISIAAGYERLADYAEECKAPDTSDRPRRPRRQRPRREHRSRGRIGALLKSTDKTS
jgi:hypothetical protein